MRHYLRALLTIFAAVTAGSRVGADPPDAGRGAPVPASFLTQMAGVASLYRDTALKFECTEAIEYKSYDGTAPRNAYVKFSYLYERDPKGRLTNCRMWRDNLTNGKNIRCVDPGEYKIPFSLNNAYLWIFAFLEDRQPWMDYRIVGEATALGRRAVIVDYAPRSVIRANFNDWYGRAWIDSESRQLLRVEAYRPESWKALQLLNQARATPAPADAPHDEHEVERVVTEFDETKNGMRFASRVRLERSRYSWKNDFKEKKLFDVVQTYGKYRFYNVATEAQVRGIVDGTGVLGPGP